MARIFERADLTANDDLADFEEAMSADLEKLLSIDDENPAENAPMSPLVRSSSKVHISSC